MRYSFQAAKYSRKSGAIINSPIEAFNACQELMKMDRECAMILCLDPLMRLRNKHLVHIGGKSGISLSISDILRLGLTDSSEAIVFIHNHPMTTTNPSRNDIKATRALIKACKLVEMPLIDSIIICPASKEKFRSLRQYRPKLWEAK